MRHFLIPATLFNRFAPYIDERLPDDVKNVNLVQILSKK